MFDTLSDRITGSFKNLRSKGRLTASDVEQTIGEIRRALLDADVALPVVRSFTAAVREQATGALASVLDDLERWLASMGDSGHSGNDRECYPHRGDHSG